MRIVHVVPTLCNGGTERYLVNLLEGTKGKCENDVISYDSRNYWAEELKKLNVRVTVLDKPNKVGIIKNYRDLRNIFKKNNYDVVYAYTYFNSAYVLLAAMMSGVRIRIAHAHTSATDHNRTIGYKVYSVISKILLSFVANNKLACSTKAGKALFYTKFRILKNSIDLKKYAFSCDARKRVREKLGIKHDANVFGIVGRLDKNKNQMFAIDAFLEYISINPNSILLIIGDGGCKKLLNSMISKYSLDKKVLMLGSIDNVADYYSSMDVLLMTSIHEGFPFVLIEAQANGLPVIASSTIDKDTKINDNFAFVDLKKGPVFWATVMKNMINERAEPCEKIKQYSIQENSFKIMNIYKGGRKWK